MSYLWFTSDIHLGHANIAKYCNRPWFKKEYVDDENNWASEYCKTKCASDMNEALIRNWNARVGPGDTVIHVGDFCCKGAERGIGGLRTKAEEWEQLLNGKIIFIRGNHDKNNGLKFALDSATIVIGKKLALIRHRPIEIKKEVPVHVDFVICGHVHQKWRTKSIDGILNINVGVDANKFYPIRNDELVGLYSANSEERA